MSVMLTGYSHITNESTTKKTLILCSQCKSRSSQKNVLKKNEDSCRQCICCPLDYTRSLLLQHKKRWKEVMWNIMSPQDKPLGEVEISHKQKWVHLCFYYTSGSSVHSKPISYRSPDYTWLCRAAKHLKTKAATREQCENTGKTAYIHAT